MRSTVLFLAAAALWGPVSGCSAVRPPSTTPATEVAVEPVPAPRAAETPATEPDVPDGVFHRIEPGQTLWRIARAYGVAVDELLSVNRLADPGALASGSMLFVPGAGVLLNVPPYPAPPPAPAAPGRERDAPVALDPGGFVWPVSGGGVLSRFGAPRKGRRHAGIDIRGLSGQEILAAEAGEVVYSGSTFSGYGKTVILDHGAGLESVYAHGSDLLVEVGEHVARGQVVARVGRTGNATTEHCHFELRQNKIPIDPLSGFPEIARALAATDAEVAAKHGAAASRRSTGDRAHAAAAARATP